MRNTFLIVTIFLTTLRISGQDYTISFQAEGASTTIDNIKVENLVQNTSVNLNTGDVLHLSFLTGMQQNEDLNYPVLNIYPNPSDGYSNAEFENPGFGTVNLSLYDINGKVVAESSQTAEKGILKYMINTPVRGVYFLKVLSGGTVTSARIINSGDIRNPARIIFLNYEDPSLFIKTKSNQKKGLSSEIFMQYNAGEVLKFTATSGNLKTIIADVPGESKTLTFNLVECKDGDNNNYPVVKIGTQTWMAENLKTTKFSDETDIPLVNTTSTWNALLPSDKAYCYRSDLATYGPVYGALYTWPAATGGACPTGWHLPSDTEWGVLETYLGGNTIAGGKMKETGIEHWNTPNTGATNTSGFTGLPGSIRNSDGVFGNYGVTAGYWWSSSSSSNLASYRNLGYNHTTIFQNLQSKEDGMSVRCIKN